MKGNGKEMKFRIKYQKERDGAVETYENVSIIKRWRSIETGGQGFLVSVPERITKTDTGIRKFLSHNILQIT